MDKKTLDKVCIRIIKLIKDMEDIDPLDRIELIGNINNFLNYDDYLDNIRALNEVYRYKRLNEKISYINEEQQQRIRGKDNE
jgi:hypothetical protein